MTLRRKVLIVGAGGHAKVVIDSIDKSKFEVAGCIEQSNMHKGEMINGVPIIGTDKDLEILRGKGIECAVIGIGHLGDSSLRQCIYDRLLSLGYELINAIHPSATISPYAVIGTGVMVMAGVVINANAKVGNNTIINTGAIIEHDVQIGDGVHIAPRVVISGGSSIGTGTFVGVGSIIIQGISIGEESIVGAGSTVLTDISDHVVVVGCPAKIAREIS